MKTEDALKVLTDEIAKEVVEEPKPEENRYSELSKQQEKMAEQIKELEAMYTKLENKYATSRVKENYPDFDEAEVSRLIQEYAASIPGLTAEEAESFMRKMFDHPEGLQMFYLANKAKKSRRPDEHIRAGSSAAPAADIRDALKNPTSAGEALLRLVR